MHIFEHEHEVTVIEVNIANSDRDAAYVQKLIAEALEKERMFYKKKEDRAIHLWEQFFKYEEEEESRQLTLRQLEKSKAEERF